MLVCMCVCVCVRARARAWVRQISVLGIQSRYYMYICLSVCLYVCMYVRMYARKGVGEGPGGRACLPLHMPLYDRIEAAEHLRLAGGQSHHSELIETMTVTSSTVERDSKISATDTTRSRRLPQYVIMQ